MQNAKQMLFGLVAFVIAVAVVWGFLGMQKNGEFRNTYSVVYLTSGEIYVAKISVFPKFVMEDPYLLLLVQDEKRNNNFQLTPINDAVWAPKKLYVERDQILYFGPLKEDGKVLETLKNAGK